MREVTFTVDNLGHDVATGGRLHQIAEEPSTLEIVSSTKQDWLNASILQGLANGEEFIPGLRRLNSIFLENIHVVVHGENIKPLNDLVDRLSFRWLVLDLLYDIRSVRLHRSRALVKVVQRKDQAARCEQADSAWPRVDIDRIRAFTGLQDRLNLAIFKGDCSTSEVDRQVRIGFLKRLDHRW